MQSVLIIGRSGPRQQQVPFQGTGASPDLGDPSLVPHLPRSRNPSSALLRVPALRHRLLDILARDEVEMYVDQMAARRKISVKDRLNGTRGSRPSQVGKREKGKKPNFKDVDHLQRKIFADFLLVQRQMQAMESRMDDDTRGDDFEVG